MNKVTTANMVLASAGTGNVKTISNHNTHSIFSVSDSRADGKSRKTAHTHAKRRIRFVMPNIDLSGR